MMSDNTAPTCKEGDDIGLVSGTNISSSETPHTGQWMAHWLQASRNLSSENCQLHADALTGNTLHQFKGHDSLTLDQVKSKEFKLVRVDMNQRYSFVGKGKSNTTAEDDQLSYALRSGEAFEVDRGKFKINDAENSFSEKLSTQQLTESYIKWKNSGSYCCDNLDMSESNFEHFPMNRKIETMLGSKKTSSYGAVSVKMVKENLSLCEFIGTSSVVKLGPGSCLEAKEIIADAEKVMTTYEESYKNLKSVNTGERFHKFSSTIKYLLIEDKVDKFQCLGERTMGDSAFTQVNESSSSKTVTIPTKQNYGKKEKSTGPLQNILSDEDRNDWDDTGANLMEEHNEFSTKADTICYHPFHESGQLLGEYFSRQQKGVTCPNLLNSKPTSASFREVTGRNVETGMHNRKEVEQPASKDETTYANHKEASVSSTESLAADHIASHSKESDVSSSNPLPDHTCSRWIKRFKDDHSETLSLCTKKLKKCYDSSSEIQQTLSRIQSYNPISYVLPCGDSDESGQLWMRRWCRKDNEASQTTSKPNLSLTLHSEELRVSIEKFERTMPASIGAMALMGKAMNNYRPCRFRREDGSLVWNTEE